MKEWKNVPWEKEWQEKEGVHTSRPCSWSNLNEVAPAHREKLHTLRTIAGHVRTKYGNSPILSLLLWQVVRKRRVIYGHIRIFDALLRILPPTSSSILLPQFSLPYPPLLAPFLFPQSSPSFLVHPFLDRASSPSNLPPISFSPHTLFFFHY